MSLQRRMLYAQLAENKNFAMMSDKAQKTYIFMVVLADDEGRVKGDSDWLRIKIFPYDQTITKKDMQGYIKEIHQAQLILWYKCGNDYFIQHPNWEKYQKLRIDRMVKSDIPAPDDEYINKDLFPNNSNLPRSLIKKVWERDGEKCRYCGNESKPFHIDHVYPVVLGGKNTLDNLVVSCEKCNTSKGSRILDDLGWKLLPVPTIPSISRHLSDNRPHKISKISKLNKVSEDDPTNTSKSSINYLQNIPEKDSQKLLSRFDITKKQLDSKCEDLYLYCKTHSKRYNDYSSFLLKAVKKDFKEKSQIQKLKLVELQTPENVERKEIPKHIKEGINSLLKGMTNPISNE